MKKKIVVGISGASGSIYAKVLLDKLSQLDDQVESVGIILSSNAKRVWKDEIGDSSYENYPFQVYSSMDFDAPFASGSAKYGSMVICPCSMGTLGRIASGTSNDLMSRAADVILKEERKLILVPRDTPLSLIHLENLVRVKKAGATILPACPSFYSMPKNFEEMAATVVDRIIDQLGLEQDSFRWGE